MYFSMKLLFIFDEVIVFLMKLIVCIFDEVIIYS